jgi:hypothetical protein
MKIDTGFPGGKSVLRNWRREQAPSMDGPWITADATDASITVAIVPPGTPVTGGEDERCEHWRLAWWRVVQEDDLLGVPPAGEMVVSLEEALSLMPRRLARLALAWEREAERHSRLLASPDAHASTLDEPVAHGALDRRPLHPASRVV